MNMITTKDGTQIYYKDWGKGTPLVFSHGWPLSSDAWDPQMLFFAENGYRVIAHDRRGHGRSSHTWYGNDMDTYADDLAALIEALDLQDTTLVGHSTGSGEVIRYISRHGSNRVSKLVLIGTIAPIMLKTEAYPAGIPMSVFDELRAAFKANRSQFYQDIAIAFYGLDLPNAKKSQGIMDAFWFHGMQGSFKAQYDCIKQFSETDFTEDLKKIDLPTLILHGDEDQMVPIGNSSLLTSRLMKNSTLKVYPGESHGICATIPDKVNADILAFIQE